MDQAQETTVHIIRRFLEEYDEFENSFKQVIPDIVIDRNCSESSTNQSPYVQLL